MPLKVFVKDLAIVTAGFSNEVEDVNQHEAGEEHRQRHAGGGGNSTEMINP